MKKFYEGILYLLCVMAGASVVLFFSTPPATPKNPVHNVYEGYYEIDHVEYLVNINEYWDTHSHEYIRDIHLYPSAGNDGLGRIWAYDEGCTGRWNAIFLNNSGSAYRTGNTWSGKAPEDNRTDSKQLLGKEIYDLEVMLGLAMYHVHNKEHLQEPSPTPATVPAEAIPAANIN